MTAQELEQLINQFEQQEKALPGSGSYPISVLTSMLTNLHQWGKLSPRQLEFVGNLKEQIQSPVELAAWKEDFLTKYKERFDYAVEFYRYNQSPYYSDTILKATENKDFIPSRKQYDSIAGNKYSKRILEEMLEKEPKFAPGDVVQMRDSYPRRQTTGAAYHSAYFSDSIGGGYWKEPEKNWCYIVVKNDVMPANPCIGCRRYELLPFGDSRILKTEERYIKKART